MEKTYKREVATGMLVGLTCLFGYGMYAENLVMIDVAKFVTTPVFMFALGAFGLDALAKQIK